MHIVLEIRNMTKRFGDALALTEFCLEIRHNEYLSLLGPSGCGKSTLLRLIAGFDRPDSGDVLLDGRSIVTTPAHQRGIGFVSQGFALFPHMSVFDNVAFGLRHRSDAPLTEEGEVRRRVASMLELVGLGDLGGRQTGQISGGQKQRVALARTLVADPKIILLDEPLGALDANLRSRMTLELRRIRQQLGVTFVHVTGNELEALAMGDRVVVMDAGAVVQVDSPDVVYNRPASARVAHFLNRYNSFAGRVGPDGRFVADAGVLEGPVTAHRPPAGAGVYCIRFDRVQVSAAADPLPPGQTGILGSFIASEYSGPSIAYFFRLATGQVVEVEYHLSHRRPDEFDAGAPYRLSWPAAEALVYA